MPISSWRVFGFTRKQLLGSMFVLDVSLDFLMQVEAIIIDHYCIILIQHYYCQPVLLLTIINIYHYYDH